MIFTLASLLVIILSIASVPLLRTLSISVDQWADAVHGQEAEPLN